MKQEKKIFCSGDEYFDKKAQGEHCNRREDKKEIKFPIRHRFSFDLLRFVDSKETADQLKKKRLAPDSISSPHVY
jgi:hypothetical protein